MCAAPVERAGRLIARLNDALHVSGTRAPLFWGTAEVGETGALFPSEQAAIARAVPGRQREFMAGRIAARRALSALGHPPVAIPAGADRAPIWPAGLSGSISHAAGLAVAVMARAPCRLGVDLATDEALSEPLISEICLPEERARAPLDALGRFAKQVFSAKEAAYKAQYPVTGLLYGFHGMVLEVPGAPQSSPVEVGVDVCQFSAHYTAHPELQGLPPELRVPYPVVQVAGSGIILSLSVRA